MALNFVAIDVETASQRWESICAISLVKVVDGCIVDTFTTLINPECDFSPINMRIHGITALAVADAPTFPQIASKIIDFIGDNFLIAHNIPFDANALARAFQRYDIPVPVLDTFCTLASARAYCPTLDNHTLPSVCARFDVNAGRHHDAGDDAHACAEIMIRLAGELHADSIPDVAAALYLRLGHMSPSSVISPSAIGKYSSYGSMNKKKYTDNPFAIIDSIRSAAPDISNEIEMDQLSDGRSVVFRCSGAVLFYLTLSATSSFIRMPQPTDPAAITHEYTIYKNGDYKLPFNPQFDFEVFIAQAAALAKQYFDQVASEHFLCCNDFLRCSDARRCLKLDNPDYRRCEYRKNLEAGRIFYGKNRTV